MSDPETGDTGFDLEAGVADIAESLGFGPDEDELPDGTPEGDTPATEPDVAAAPAGDTTTPSTKDGEPPTGAVATPRAAPKSWAKETHELWGKLDPKVQEYVEKREKDFLDGTETYRSEAAYSKQVKEMLAPYKAMFNAAGVDETKGVQYLLNAQYRLTNGTPEERAAAYRDLGASLGLSAPQAVDPNAPTPDPIILQLRQELDGVKSALTRQEQLALEARQSEVSQTIEKFKADPAHPHFDEVANDMATFIKAGLSLDDAYDRAVNANPITREILFQKRLTDAETEKQKKAREEGAAAARATTHNVRGAETSQKSPTGKKGSMEDTMRETLGSIRGRAH